MKTEPNDAASGYGYCTADGGNNQDRLGLTKREELAKSAMTGMLASMEGSGRDNDWHPCTATFDYIARLSVYTADQLIKELNK